MDEAMGQSHIPGISRRRFLKFGLLGSGGALLVGAGGGGTLLALRGAAPAVEGLAVLSAHEYRTLAAIAQVHLPEGGLIPPSAKDFDIARAFDTFLAGEPKENTAQIKQALLLFEYGPLVFDGKWATFSNLPAEMQLAHWVDWGKSEMLMRRQVSMILRKFMSLVYFDHPEVWRHIAYPIPTFSGVDEI